MLEENEVSVYDLKDHPDFQYRPGTVVIRVANFEGEDANSTAGQVLDNYPEGMVRILIIVLNERLYMPSYENKLAVLVIVVLLWVTVPCYVRPFAGECTDIIADSGSL
jgi:hypothetical protein